MAKNYKLAPEQRALLLEWIAEGFSNEGIKTQMLYVASHYDPAVPGSMPPFPDITAPAISYWRRRLKQRVEEERARMDALLPETSKRGLRDRERRIQFLVRAAEKLWPYVGEANDRGEFTASIQFAKLVDQITLLVDGDPKAKKPEQPADLSSLSLEQLQALTMLTGAMQGSQP